MLQMPYVADGRGSGGNAPQSKVAASKKSSEISLLFFGATWQTRTADLRVTNALLYRLS